MAAPTRYNLSYDFTGFQSANPNTPLPADKIEIEFTNVETSLGQTITNLNLLQRSDGKLNNGLVEFDSLSNAMKALLGTTLNPRGDWAANVAYKQLDLVSVGDTTYIAVVDHASFTSFTVDLVAGKWLLWANPGFVDGTSYFEKFSGDGTTTEFTVAQDMGTDENGLLIFINNSGWVPQAPTAFTINGTTLTFNSAPPNGTNNIYVFAPAKILSQAAAYAVAAGNSASSADASATSAAGSASTASTAATNAGNSATAAANSASAAATSATNAASSASTASTAATNATTQATNASNSATAAAASASAAGNSEDNASDSAAAAADSETNAANSATAAANSASTASAAATSASASATAAAASAASVPQHTFTETTDPTENDDTTQGYSAGSVWVNTATDTFFVCTDATEGAAVWSTGGGGDTSEPRMINSGTTATFIDNDNFIAWNSAANNNKTLTLGVPTRTQTLVVKDAIGTAEAYPVTISASGCTIDGGSSFVLDLDYGAVTLKWDGTSNWMVF